jgi:Ca2+/Na+ antiporter
MKKLFLFFLILVVFNFVSAATTIKLQTADVENLEDTRITGSTSYVNYNYGTSTDIVAGETGTADTPWWTYIKFNISSVPASQTISDATLCFFVDWNFYDSGETVTSWVYSLDNQSWVEGTGKTDGTEVCWNNKVIGDTSLLDTNSSIAWDLDDFWLCFNVTSWVSSEYSSGNKNVSFVWNATIEYGSFDRLVGRSKEDQLTGTRPYLNITYESEPAPADTPELVRYNINYANYHANTSNYNLYFNLDDQPAGLAKGEEYNTHWGFYSFLGDWGWLLDYPVTQLAILALAWFLLPVSLVLKRKYIIYVVCMFLMVVGVWTYINGISTFNDWLTRAVGLATIVVGLVIILLEALNIIGGEEKWSEETMT